MEGDESQFKVQPSQNISFLEPLDLFEPVIVFEGSSYSDNLDIHSFTQIMDDWLTKFPELVLACDVFYPQFPKRLDDPLFDNSPIVPEELDFKKLIQKYSLIEGYSIKNPSIFCLTHVFPASLEELNLATKNNASLSKIDFSNWIKQ